MFIDFLTLVMINMVAGTVLLAYYLWKGIDEKDQRPYAAGFGGVGLVALVTSWQLQRGVRRCHHVVRCRLFGDRLRA